MQQNMSDRNLVKVQQHCNVYFCTEFFFSNHDFSGWYGLSDIWLINQFNNYEKFDNDQIPRKLAERS